MVCNHGSLMIVYRKIVQTILRRHVDKELQVFCCWRMRFTRVIIEVWVLRRFFIIGQAHFWTSARRYSAYAFVKLGLDIPQILLQDLEIPPDKRPDSKLDLENLSRRFCCV